MMVLRSVLFLFVLILLNGIPAVSFAQDDASDLSQAQNDALREQISTIMKSVTQAEAQHFAVMYSNYSLYSTVKAVGEDIRKAVDSCADNNKSMDRELREKFTAWDKNVGSIMKESEDSITSLSLAQNYISQADLKVLFGLVDSVRRPNSSKFEKIPVTTPEACEFMMSKMDETAESMSALLRTTLVSYPNVLRQMQK